MKIFLISFVLTLALLSSAFAVSAPDFESSRNMSTSSLQTLKRVTFGVFTASSPSDIKTATATYSLSNSSGSPKIPEGALITDVYYKVKTTITAASTNNTISVGCATSNDLVDTISVDGFTAGQIKTGIPTGVPSSTGVVLSASCSPVITVDGESGGISEGDLYFVFEYVPLD